MEFRVTRIYADENGESHFEPLPNYPMEDFMPGLAFTEVMPAEGFFLESFAADFFYDWYTPPGDSRYAEFFLEGSMKLVASDGEEKLFSQGDLLFFEDLTGKGHQAFGVTPGKSVLMKLGS